MHTVSVLKPFSINLDSNPTTGYTWTVDDIDDTYIQYVGYTYINKVSDDGRIGAGKIMQLRFIPIKRGTSTIILAYKRLWTGGDTADTRAYTFRIV